MIKGILIAAMGVLLTYVGWTHWRLRNEDTISLFEAGILKAANEEPLPRTGLDRFLARLQAIFGLVLGPVFIFLGTIVSLSEMDLV